jgi:DNA-binding transcriptional LysR family regulator
MGVRMNARQLEVFRSIMRLGTLTAAARALNVSQPALSQVLLHTEDQLGFRLFRRVKGRLVPTPEAEQLFPEADRVFGELEDLRRFASDLGQGKAGQVRLAASPPPALTFVPTALARFRTACPGVRLVSYVVPVAVMAEMLARGAVDLGVAMSDAPMPQVESERIGESEVAAVLPAGHRLAAKPSLTARDLAGERLICYRGDSLPGAMIARAFAEAGVELRCEVEIDASIVALSFVQAGLGAAIVDGLLPWGTFAGIVARPFQPRIALPLSLLTPAARPAARSHDLLRRMLREAARGGRRLPP